MFSIFSCLDIKNLVVTNVRFLHQVYSRLDLKLYLMSKLKAQIKFAIKRQNQAFIAKRRSLNITQPAQPHTTNRLQSYQQHNSLPLHVQINKRYNEKPAHPYLKNTYFRSSKTFEDVKKVAQQLPHQAIQQQIFNRSSFKSSKVIDNKLKGLAEIEQLNIKAKQFIKVVKQQKSRIKGKFFYLRQKQEYKKKIKQQIDSLEKTFIKHHYQEKRRREADQHIRFLNKRALERQSQLKKSHMGQSSQQLQREALKVSFYVHKQSQNQGIPKNKKQISRSDRTKTQPLQQQVPIFILNQQDLKDINQVRKKLIQLNNLMNKQQKLKKAEYDHY